MFRLEAHQLLYVYTGLGVAIVLIGAMLHGISRIRRERSALRNVVKCGMCAFQFRNVNGLVHPRCPNCASLVEQKEQSRL
jgi:hypothetical protein